MTNLFPKPCIFCYNIVLKIPSLDFVYLTIGVTDVFNINILFQAKWINRERVLVFGTRGISFQHRHLMKDIIKLLPHAKSANKMERKENLFVVNEVNLVMKIIIIFF